MQQAGQHGALMPSWVLRPLAAAWSLVRSFAPSCLHAACPIDWFTV